MLALDGVANEIGPVFAIPEEGRNSLEGPLREPSLHILSPSFLPAHATGHN
jgi:hypothetical protein